jgi:hypothetical protein
LLESAVLSGTFALVRSEAILLQQLKYGAGECGLATNATPDSDAEAVEADSQASVVVRPVELMKEANKDILASVIDGKRRNSQSTEEGAGDGVVLTMDLAKTQTLSNVASSPPGILGVPGVLGVHGVLCVAIGVGRSDDYSVSACRVVTDRPIGVGRPSTRR